MRCGEVRFGLAGQARRGQVWQARLGKARFGSARRGRVWQAGFGKVWCGMAGCGLAGMEMPKRKEVIRMSIYQWKMNLYKVNAQSAGEYLASLESRDGEVIPFVLVEESKSETSILHPCFEWDDDKAAEHYRIHQAKSLIRNIVIVYQKDEKAEPVAVRAFIHTCEADEKQPRYISIETALSDEVLKNRLLESAIRELNEFRRKYKDLVELSKVFHIIDEALYEKV